MRQKDVFLEGEGDAWYLRNSGGASRILPQGDPLLSEILALSPPIVEHGTRVLEIGCSEGVRLEWLARERGCDCSGIDPSLRAVSAAAARGVRAQRGTAEALPFGDASFDVVAFGFCLYLCDRQDLFRIAAEADRVLRDPGWMAIYDFYAPHPARQEYSHFKGVSSHKMDNRALFAWHPAYTTYSHRVFHHVSGEVTDEQGEWVAVSILRKHGAT
jgi:ubiquinone/menaquinone biosynthesis C-methylase UbiE